MHDGFFVRAVVDAEDPDLWIVDRHFVVLRINFDGVLGKGCSSEEKY
jgi:hypothetical protein